MPSALLSRREPQGYLKGFSNVTGLTTVELLVFVAVLVIITSLAIPSWNTLQERKQVSRSAEQMASFLSRARIESVMRNEVLTVSYQQSDVDQWCVGVMEGEQACNCNQYDASAADFCRVDMTHRVFSQSNLEYPSILDSIRGDGSFSIDPVTGDLTDSDDRVELDLVSDRGSYALSIHLGGSGQVEICSENSGTRVPGYGLC